MYSKPGTQLIIGGALYEVRNDSFAQDSGNASCRVIPLSDARGLSDGSGHTTRTYVRAIKAVLASLRSAVPHSESGTGAERNRKRRGDSTQSEIYKSDTGRVAIQNISKRQ